MKQHIYIILGIISIIIAVVGVVLPVLPTTPFVLLALWLFTHSSPKLLRKVMRNKMLYTYVTNYRRKGGLAKKSKILAILYMWLMVILSIFFQIENIIVKHIIVLIALIGTFVMGFVVPTAKK